MNLMYALLGCAATIYGNLHNSTNEETQVTEEYRGCRLPGGCVTPSLGNSKGYESGCKVRFQVRIM
ncbi:hypothetical protein J6590_078891 [Homalodisca vitripennis]|nr:hypothetical protein J6590_078891 [Homalodisca vitripennis]